MTYGTIIPNLTIAGEPAPYPVVNERSIRATAGIMFAIGISTFWYVFLTEDYTPMPYIVALFWLDFFLKAVIDPKYSIFGIFGKFMTRKQKPEYVGAIQKRFAWSLGLAMATAMIIVAILLGIRGWPPLAICSTCLLFMWLESACGICVGCKIYSWFLKKGILPQPKVKPACPGGVCSLKK